MCMYLVLDASIWMCMCMYTQVYLLCVYLPWGIHHTCIFVYLYAYLHVFYILFVIRVEPDCLIVNIISGSYAAISKLYYSLVACVCPSFVLFIIYARA
ncbi:hypothetical protein EON63_24440 [archaeon]|nr:MAG: hypothetical protein EON63_24440 [archaeon]